MWVTYKNGNYFVDINLNDGTKIRYNDSDSFRPERPESMDITISTYCEMGCEFCYAGCSKNGKHADIMSHSFIDNLEPYTELALNGNEPLHPDLVPFLYKCRELKLIPSLTVNQHTFMKNIGLLKKLSNDRLIYGVGVSLSNPTDEFIEAVSKFPNAVIHTVCGIVSMNNFRAMSGRGLKILLLGYKDSGRGIDYHNCHDTEIERNKIELYNALPNMIDNEWYNVISFDNLALEQLDVERLMSEDEWARFYLGDDGSHSMYIDMVEKKFAKSSISNELYNLEDDIKTMFDNVRSKEGV